MDVAGLVLGIYKDVYFLAKSVYRLATSAKHYKAEQRDVLYNLYHEFLRLRSFHHVMFVLRSKELANDGHSVEVLKHAGNTIKRLGEALSDFKVIAIKEDEQYRKYNIATQPLLLEFPVSIDDLLSPSDLDSPRPKKFGSILSLRALMRIFKNPIFTTDAWLWVLFERSRLQQAVMDFRQCNLELGDFVPILLWSTALTRQDLGNIVRNISEESSPASQNAQSFLPHIRIREVAEYSNSTVHDSDTLEFSPLPDARQVFASISSTGMVTEAIPKARVEFKYYRPCGDYGQNLEDDPIGKSTSEIGGELQSKDPLIAQAHQLARLLFEAGSHEFHTLPFRGYLNDPSSSRFAFYFDYPQDVSDHEPTTLHRLIEDGNGASRLYLPQRFKIALTISRALGAFHADGWVHKSVRSHSVIFFYNNENQSMYDKPYLVDFEFSRPDAGATLLAFDDDLERNLYRHPDRQELPIIGFNKMHDVYALGIVLLELGLWQTARSIYDTARKEGREASVRNATRMQGTYLACARKDIGHIMGPDYLEAVITCLSGELSEFLNKKDFAFMFWKKVVEKVDPRRLLNSASE